MNTASLYIHYMLCSLHVWTTLSSWNNFGALDYKDENPLCSLQLITEQLGKRCLLQLSRGSGETTSHANNDGPMVTWIQVQNPGLFLLTCTPTKQAPASGLTGLALSINAKLVKHKPLCVIQTALTSQEQPPKSLLRKFKYR